MKKGTHFRVFLYSFLLLLFGQSLNGQVYDYTSIQNEVPSKANYVTWLDHTQVTVHSPSKFTKRHAESFTILNKKSGKEKLYVSYDNLRKIKYIKATLYDKNGKKIRSIKKKEIKDFDSFDGVSIYDDNRYKQLEFSHSEYPYTVRIEYEIEYSDRWWYPDFYIASFNEHLIRAEYELILPSSMDCQYYNVNTTVEPEITEKVDTKSYHWAVDQAPLLQKEPFLPNMNKLLPRVVINSLTFEAGGIQGSMESWQSYGNFSYKLNDNRQEISADLKAQIQDLIKDCISNKEKIDILYKYVQDKTRYVSIQLGLGGWQTYDAAYVEENQYGDCKALTNYMMTLLAEVGIQSNAALVSANDESIFHSDKIVNPTFNHVILYVPEEDMWIECTSDKNAAGYLGAFTEDKFSLLIDEEESKLIRTPSIPIENNKEHFNATIIINEDGSSNIEGEIKYTGTKYEHTNWVNNKDSKEVEEFILNKVDLSNATLLKSNISVDNQNQSALVTFSIEMDRFGSKSGKRMFLPLTIFQKLSYIPPKDDDRKFDIEAKHNYIENNHLNFVIPRGYIIESMPSEIVEIENSLGIYTCQTAKTDLGFSYSRTFNRHSLNLPKEKYNDVRQSYIDIAKADKSKVVLNSDRKND